MENRHKVRHLPMALEGGPVCNWCPFNDRRNLKQHIAAVHASKILHFYENGDRLYTGFCSYKRDGGRTIYVCGTTPGCLGSVNVDDGKTISEKIKHTKCDILKQRCPTSQVMEVSPNLVFVSGSREVMYDGQAYRQEDDTTYIGATGRRLSKLSVGKWVLTPPSHVDCAAMTQMCYSNQKYKCAKCPFVGKGKEVVEGHYRDEHICKTCPSITEKDQYEHFQKKHSFLYVKFKQYFAPKQSFETLCSRQDIANFLSDGSVVGTDYVHKNLKRVPIPQIPKRCTKKIMLEALVLDGKSIDPNFKLETITTNEIFAASFLEQKKMLGARYFEWYVQKSNLSCLRFELELQNEAPPYSYGFIDFQDQTLLRICMGQGCGAISMHPYCNKHDPDNRTILYIVHMLCGTKAAYYVGTAVTPIPDESLASIDTLILHAVGNNDQNISDFFAKQNSLYEGAEVVFRHVIDAAYLPNERLVEELAAEMLVALFTIVEAANAVNETQATVVNERVGVGHVRHTGTLIEKSGMLIQWNTEADQDGLIGEAKASVLELSEVPSSAASQFVYLSSSIDGSFYIGQKSNRNYNRSLSHKNKGIGRSEYEMQSGLKMAFRRTLAINTEELDEWENQLIYIATIGISQNKMVPNHRNVRTNAQYRIVNKQLLLKPARGIFSKPGRAQVASYFAYGTYLQLLLPKTFQSSSIKEIMAMTTSDWDEKIRRIADAPAPPEFLQFAAILEDLRDRPDIYRWMDKDNSIFEIGKPRELLAAFNRRFRTKYSSCGALLRDQMSGGHLQVYSENPPIYSLIL